MNKAHRKYYPGTLSCDHREHDNIDVYVIVHYEDGIVAYGHYLDSRGKMNFMWSTELARMSVWSPL